MSRPGVNVLSQDSSSPRSRPTDTGQAFAAGYTQKGPTDVAVLLKSMTELKRKTGARVSSSLFYDAAESYFKSGGTRLWLSRFVGPAAVVAKHTFNDGAGTPAATIRVEAANAGAWGNSLQAAIEYDEDDNWRLVITDADGSSIATSPYFEDAKAEAVEWGEDRTDVHVVSLGTSVLKPAEVAAQALTTGADDIAGITDDERIVALELFTRDLGPGQVCIPGATTAEALQAVDEHADANNRVALKAAPDTSDESALKTWAASLRGTGRFGGGMAPWPRVPGFVGGTTRLVPPELMVAGKLAANDASYPGGVGQSVPAAGDHGILSWALGVSQPAWSDDVREELNAAGINVIREMLGGVRIYGWRTLVDPASDPDWTNLGHRRLYVALHAKFDNVGERFMFRDIDGRGHLLGEYNAALRAVAVPYWENGELYGATFDDACRIDTATVNTPETIADKQLNAQITCCFSEFAEEVNIYITKNRITEGVN